MSVYAKTGNFRHSFLNRLGFMLLVTNYAKNDGATNSSTSDSQGEGYWWLNIVRNLLFVDPFFNHPLNLIPDFTKLLQLLFIRTDKFGRIFQIPAEPLS